MLVALATGGAAAWAADAAVEARGGAALERHRLILPGAR